MNHRFNDQWRAELAYGYQQSLEFNLGVKNLTDEDIYITQVKEDLVALGATRMFYGSVNYKF